LWLFNGQSASAQKILRWGADPSGGAPYVFNDPANPDQYIGYEKEMVDALAKAMGRRAEFVPSDWETLVPALQRKSFDVIVNGLEPTGDRAQQILFSNPYYIFQLQLTVRRDDNRINSIDDCKNRVVGTLGNTAASRMLEQRGIPLRSYQDPVGAYRDLELKRIDAVVMDVPAEAFYARSNPKLRQAGPPFTRGQYVIGLRKGDDELKAEVDAAIKQIISDGTLETILKKWGLWNDAQVEFQNPIRTGTQPAKVEEYTNTTTTFNWREALWRLTRAAAVTVLLALGSMVIAVVLGLPLADGPW
jgi:polar amino acid transport system substrate-binding protein